MAPAQLLAARNPTSREIKTNTGDNGALETFNSGNLNPDAFGFTGTDAEKLAKLFSFFGVANQDELDDLIKWSTGVDVQDEDGDGRIDDTRPWILGDMLHSAPLVINYGGSEKDPDLRVVVGTNAGFLHMFDVSDGKEDWAFFPKELAPVLGKRLLNEESKEHIYGIDSSPVAYIRDVNNDGTLKGDDKVFVYFGLRRGGRGYYALDLSKPDTPKYKWMISNTTSPFPDDDFSELGQSWSEPVPTTIAGYADGSGKPKPVIIFGGGFDVNKDTPDVATPDSMGRAIYIVDADSGKLVWSVSPADGLQHGIAARVVVLDSNGDGTTDRIYAADTGGNVWRVDLAGTDKSKWGIVKLAAFNGGDAANDRRFFNTPDIVRARRGALAFDAVLIGSGDRTNPTEKDVENRFYMIQDKQISPYTNARPTTADCNDSTSPRYNDFRCKLPLGESDLYDATADLIQEGDAAEQVAASADLYSASGWYIRLEERPGEKSLASSITVGGNVVFTTFAPALEVTINEDICKPATGQAYLYTVSLLDASAVFNFDKASDKLEKIDRRAEMGTMILDTPSPYVGEDGRIRLVFPASGAGNPVGEMKGSIFDTRVNLEGPKGLYWYQAE